LVLTGADSAGLAATALRALNLGWQVAFPAGPRDLGRWAEADYSLRVALGAAGPAQAGGPAGGPAQAGRAVQAGDPPEPAGPVRAGRAVQAASAVQAGRLAERAGAWDVAMCTSGTTGSPRTFGFTAGQLAGVCGLYRDYYRLDERAVIVTALPA